MSVSLVFVLPNEKATRRLATALAPCVAATGGVVALAGDLGVGKTAFARVLIRALTGDPDEEVPSPTFTLVQSYVTLYGLVWHFDFYRLSCVEEIIELDWEEAIARGIVLVEWPERLGLLLPAEHLEVRLVPDTAAGPDARRAIVTGHGGWGARLAIARAAPLVPGAWDGLVDG